MVWPIQLHVWLPERSVPLFACDSLSVNEEMSSTRSSLKAGLFAGLRSGWRGFLWMAEIVVPVSLAVALLQWSGWLDILGAFFSPVMSLLRLPAEAAVPIITGMLVNIYAVLAAITVLPFSIPQMTLIAIFSLIAHNFIMEGIVQHRSGINVLKITAIRFVAAMLTVFVVSRFFAGTSMSVPVSVSAAAHSPFAGALRSWAENTAWLLLKVFLIIMSIMVILGISRTMGWVEWLLRIFRPVMSAFGLSERTTMMFVTGIVFGLLYGGATIVEEARNGTITREDAERLHVSLSINHSVIEDPALFAALGINVLWLWIPRLIAAIVAVHMFRMAAMLRRRFRPVARQVGS